MSTVAPPTRRDAPTSPDAGTHRRTHQRARWFLLAGIALLLAVPWFAQWSGQPFVISLFTRFVIYAIAAASLDLILGYGALVSFGHAAFFGLGGYVVGIVAFHVADGSGLFGWAGTNEALLLWPLAVGFCALAGAGIGFLSLRTSGVQFIMITLAFGQMFYFLLVGLMYYGGDDGLAIHTRNVLGGRSLRDPRAFYLVCVVLLVVWMWLCRRIVGSRFGMALQSLKQNRKRSVALGLAPLRYPLVAFTISAAGTGLAGVLWANYALFVSPDMATWQKSGELMAMVILGGMGTIVGPALGAMVYLGLEQWLTAWTEHWMVVMGPALVLIVLFGKRGLYGLLTAFGRRRG